MFLLIQKIKIMKKTESAIQEKKDEEIIRKKTVFYALQMFLFPYYYFCSHLAINVPCNQIIYNRRDIYGCG